jgi:adenylyltransferase/sulfurtransferase
MLFGFEVSPKELKDQLDAGGDLLLLDVRDLSEYSIAHIDGARLLPMTSLATRIDSLKAHQDKPVVVYCHKGDRSLEALEVLKDAGFRELKMLAGGIDAWCEEIEPHKPRYGHDDETGGCG